MLAEIFKSLEAHALGRTEQIAIDHFKKKPEGRGFYAVAEILVKYERIDEAIQLLLQGLQRHPHYSVARVYLAFLLFCSNFYREAWDVLEASPASLRSNLSAQVLRLKLCVVMNLEAQARILCRELANQDFQDPEVHIILKHIDLKSFAQLRQDYAEHLNLGAQVAPALQAAAEGIAPPAVAPAARSSEPTSESRKPATGLGPESDNEDFRIRVASGFFSSPLAEIFVKNQAAASLDHSTLDELTRARLLRRQGLYQKAFDIYERLVYSSPGNDLLRREYNDIRELRDTQKEIDQQLDPELAKAMEKVHVIDRHIQLLKQLLGRLDEYEATS